MQLEAIIEAGVEYKTEPSATITHDDGTHYVSEKGNVRFVTLTLMFSKDEPVGAFLDAIRKNAKVTITTQD